MVRFRPALRLNLSESKRQHAGHHDSRRTLSSHWVRVMAYSGPTKTRRDAHEVSGSRSARTRLGRIALQARFKGTAEVPWQGGLTSAPGTASSRGVKGGAARADVYPEIRASSASCEERSGLRRADIGVRTRRSTRSKNNQPAVVAARETSGTTRNARVQ